MTLKNCITKLVLHFRLYRCPLCKKQIKKSNFRCLCIHDGYISNNNDNIHFLLSDDIVIADTENHRIQIFSSEGNFKFKFGTKGNKPEQINYPMCVAMTTDDNIVVTDSVNACVKLFAQDGKFLAQYGSSEVFDFPYGLTVTSNNFPVVSDICKHNITVLYPSGGVSHTFGCYGDEPRELDHPYFVAVNKDNQIVVSDVGNSCIKLFTFEGRLLRMFSLQDFRLLHELFASLQGLCSDSDGNMLVICNSTIYILARNGRLWEVVNPTDGLTTPKCLAYSPSGRIIVTQYSFVDQHEVCIFKYSLEDYKSLNALLFYAISI